MGARRVLVVDDDRDMVSTLCDILELRGFETLRGFDGEMAVSLATEHEIDCLLMDVRMPRMNGVEAWRSIHAKRPSARTVFMTAYASSEVLNEAEAHEGVRILRKPVDLQQLLQLLEDCVKRAPPQS